MVVLELAGLVLLASAFKGFTGQPLALKAVAGLALTVLVLGIVMTGALTAGRYAAGGKPAEERAAFQAEVAERLARGRGGKEYLPRQVEAGQLEAIAYVRDDLRGEALFDGRVKLPVQRNGAEMIVEFDAPKEGVLILPRFDYPTWRLRLNGAPRPHGSSPQYGLIEVTLNAGHQRVVVEHRWLWQELVGGVVSAIGFALWLLWLALSKSRLFQPKGRRIV
jgi:hypothetical protein